EPMSVAEGSSVSRLRVAQMDCPTEEALIRKKLGGISEVQSLEFNLMQRTLTLVHAPGALPAVQNAIRELGMEAEVSQSDATGTPD
ncbi:heavy metal-associated domain-containing protein, partial [Acinetobacter baumannii]